MVYTSPIFGQVSPFGAQATPYGVSPLNQIHQIQAIKQQVVAQAFQSLAATEQLALQQIQHPNPIVLQQLVPVIEQQKQQTKLAIKQLIQTKLQLLAQGVAPLQTPVHRQQVEQAVQRLTQLAQIKHQIRQLYNEAKNTTNPQQIHDNFKQVLELTQLAKLVLAQVQQSQYNQINFGNWAQSSLFSINPFTTGLNTYGYQGLFGQSPSTLAYQSAFGQSPIWGQYSQWH
jgi:leucyl aminopeptidase